MGRGPAPGVSPGGRRRAHRRPAMDAVTAAHTAHSCCVLLPLGVRRVAAHACGV